MPTLLEATATVALSAALMTTVVASLTGMVRLHTACAALGEELFEARQLEHLVDRSVAVAGSGPSHPAAVSSVTPDAVVFAADLDGDGTVDSTSSETTALEVRLASGDARVRVRLGRQTMTVIEATDSDATLTALDRRGLAADATNASLVELSIARRDPRPGDAPPRSFFFHVPARASP